jgi:hypothetical protein
MTTRLWLVVLVVGLLAIAVVSKPLFPRYEWRASREYTNEMVRIDRWTGQADVGLLRADWGRWVSYTELRRDAADKQWNFTGLPRTRDADVIRGLVLVTALTWLVGCACGWMARTKWHRRIGSNDVARQVSA